MASKNNPTNKGTKTTGKFMISSDCEKCEHKCKRGINYLRQYSIKHEGNGVWCDKK